MLGDHNVIVIGAGPAGSAAAQMLAQYELDVLLLDKSEFPRDKTCGDGLPPGALPMLRDMGLRDQVLQAGYQLDQLAFTSPTGSTSVLSIPPLPNAPSYGLVMPRLEFDDMLRNQAIRGGALFKGGVQVNNITVDDDGAVITTSAGEYRAQMVVIAVGGATQLLSSMGLVSKLPQTILAARAYFENISELPKQFQFISSGSPLPGYGWVFPTSETSANVGFGFLLTDGQSQLPSPRAAFAEFIQSDYMSKLLKGARQIGGIKDYPLRIDFAHAPTCANRILLVGEAAGLVNPLTGMGIDYALETGRLAARELIDMFEMRDFSFSRTKEYDSHLRARYQNLFEYCEFIRDTLLTRNALNLPVPTAKGIPFITDDLIATVLGGKAVPANVLPIKRARDILN